MTKYARSILNIICSNGKHKSAEEIFFLLKEEYPKVVIATVYNNLKALTEQGLIRRISVEGFPDRYDTNIRHDHMICTECGKLVDIELPDMKQDFILRTGQRIMAYDLKMYYTCEDCSG